ncbi:HD domain-containing protein [Gemmatimonadota bacterium]
MAVSDLGSVIDLLSRLSFHERMSQLGLREDRADVILPAAIVYQHLAQQAGVDEILVPGVGVKEGILLDLVDDLVSHRSHEVRQEQQLTKAAISLGRRFMFDESHGLQVARLSLSLFDQLQELHKLGEHERRLLLSAAILHDAGAFISRKGHHRHSLYVLSRSELPGLSPTDMLMVANMARYHRKSGPREAHPEFMRLSERNRDRTTRLSAILRVADALDRSHLQNVDSVQASLKKKELTLTLDGQGDFLLERWALSQKKDLFENTFGLTVSVAT